MAIRIDRKRDLSAILLVCSNDDMIGATAKDAYTKYIETLDEEHLALKGEPTRLILNLDFAGRDAERIKNAMVGTDRDGGGVKVALGTWQFTVARLALRGIVNPPDMPLHEQIIYRDEGSRVADSTLKELDRIGGLADIFACYQQHSLAPSRAEAKN